VLVSAFAFGGVPAKAVRSAVEEGNIFVSADLLNEYRNVPVELEAAGRITHPQMKALIAGIAAFVAGASFVIPHKRLTLCRDAEDNMVLECCLAAKAEILLTGDKDLLELKNLPFNLNIMTPRDFVER
jgi:uncharacterized protein